MNALNMLYGDFVLSKRASLGLLIFRVVTGLALMVHGWTKIQNPLSWMGDAVPSWLQALAAICEFGGGLALALGLLTPVACLGIICVMLGAIFIAHVPKGGAWIGGKGSFESPAGYLAAAVMFFLTGPGRYSLDRKIFGHRWLKRETVVSPRATVSPL